MELKKVGRPKGDYKYKHPETNQHISAIEYHRIIKKLKKNKDKEGKIELLIKIKNYVSGLLANESK
jgi:hypothetical protein